MQEKFEIKAGLQLPITYAENLGGSIYHNLTKDLGRYLVSCFERGAGPWSALSDYQKGYEHYRWKTHVPFDDRVLS